MKRFDPLYWLALVSAVFVILAAIAIIGERRVTREVTRLDLFAEARMSLAEIDQLDITHGAGLSGVKKITLSRDTDGVWRLVNRGGYRANQELVTETLLALFGLDVLEARTARPDWHGSLRLTAPENLGAAIRFHARAGGRDMLNLLLGRDEVSEGEARLRLANPTARAKNFFIRLAAENQTWLARGRLPRNGDMAAWIDPSLPPLTADTLRALSVMAGDKPRRYRKGAQNWPPDWLSRFAALRPIDVTRADALSFDGALTHQFTASDGLVVSVDVVGVVGDLWARYRFASPQNAAPAAQARHTELAARFADYAFKFAPATHAILHPAADKLN